MDMIDFLLVGILRLRKQIRKRELYVSQENSKATALRQPLKKF